MKPLTASQFARAARDPAALARIMSGSEIDRPAPTSPLADILRLIPPRQRAAMRGLRVGPHLGYSGSRVFQTAQQALDWIAPPHAGSSHPAESWRDKRFSRRLWLGDVLERCSSFPEGIEQALPSLTAPPRRAASPADSELASANETTPASTAEESRRQASGPA